MAVKIGAAAIGVAQPFLLRQYADTQFGTVIPQIGAYGTPSARAGIVLGGGAITAAVVGKMYGKGLTDPMHQEIALAYGVPALGASLIIAYLTPTVQAAAKSSAQGVFRPNKVLNAPAAGMSAAEKNYASITPQARLNMGVY